MATPLHTFRRVLVGAAIILGVRPALAQRTIDFNDGTPTSMIDSHYAGVGVTFFDAVWTDYPFGCCGFFSWHAAAMPGLAGPVATFGSAISSASVRGYNLFDPSGANGFMLRAYDDVTGGALVDEASVSGPALGGHSVVLTVSGANIRRLVISQAAACPNCAGGDGMLYDDLSFAPQSVAPEPTTVTLVAGGLFAVLCMAAHRRRRATAA